MKKVPMILTILMAILTLSLTVAAEKTGEKDDRPLRKTQITDVEQMLAQAKVAIAARTGEQINWQVISSGGTDGSSASYNLKGTAGQLTVGEGSSANFGLRHGYWQNFSGGGGGTCCLGPMRGNVDDDGGDNIDISDLVYLVDFMFTGGPEPPCWPEANVDGVGPDDQLDISDLVYLVDYMFTGGPPPPACP